MGRRQLDAGRAEGAVAAAADRAERTVEPGGRTCSRSEAFSSSTAPAGPEADRGSGATLSRPDSSVSGIRTPCRGVPGGLGVRKQQPYGCCDAGQLTGWEQSLRVHDLRAVEDPVRCSRRFLVIELRMRYAGRCFGGGPKRAAAVSRSGSVTRAGSSRGRAEGRQRRAASRRMRSERTRRRWCARCAVPLRRACTRARSRVR